MKQTKIILVLGLVAILSADFAVEANDRKFRNEMAGTYEGTARFNIFGGSISERAIVKLPSRRGPIIVNVVNSNVDVKIRGNINKVRCRRKVITYEGRLRVSEGPLSVSGNFRAKARLRGNRKQLTLPISLSRRVLGRRLKVTGSYKGEQS
ncbi:MAG: hypothetical protein AAGC68_07525 [Verrucomicrobiota bacterium]